MKTVTSNLIISFALIIFGCSGNEYNCDSDDPKELIGNFSSYQSIKDFESTVKKKADTIIVFEDSKLSENDSRPEFSIYTVIIPEYKFDNVTGKLRASFFNDRLMTVWFYPNDNKEFETLIKDKYDINLKNKESQIFHCVKVHRWTDFEGNEYFGWSDLKLVKEQNDWISRYS